MKQILIITILLISGLTSRADYRPLKLYEMIIKADKIVYGTILELDSSYFTLSINGSLTSDSGTLKIARFHDWPCASRWTKYEVGQRLFLFLTTWDDGFISMSGGNESEYPIIETSVFIHGFSIPIPPPSGKTWREGLIYFETKHYNIYGGEYFGIQWNLDEFIDAISFVRNYFNFTYGQYEARTNWQINCDNSELKRMSKESKLVNWINSEATQNDKR